MLTVNLLPQEVPADFAPKRLQPLPLCIPELQVIPAMQEHNRGRPDLHGVDRRV